MIKHLLLALASITALASPMNPSVEAVATEPSPSSRSHCTGANPGHIVDEYQKWGGGWVPLRCGILNPRPDNVCAGWGLLHVRCRRGFSLALDAGIVNVIARPSGQLNSGDNHLWWNRDYCVRWRSQIWSTGGWMGIRTAFPRNGQTCTAAAARLRDD